MREKWRERESKVGGGTEREWKERKRHRDIFRKRQRQRPRQRDKRRDRDSVRKCERSGDRDRDRKTRIPHAPAAVCSVRSAQTSAVSPLT